MKAFIVDSYGDKTPVRFGTVPVPEVGPRDVLVKVHAAGVNPLDVKIKAGEFKIPLPYRTPFVLGNDVAGTVERVGDQVRRFATGDPVFARPDKDRIGTFAEYIAVDEADIAHAPATVSLTEAASLPLVALTAWQALVERARIRPGQKVLIHAGTGGVGMAAIQLAKHLDAEVTTTAGAAHADLMRSLGADRVVDHRAEDFSRLLSGYYMVLDPFGPDSVLRSLRVVKPGGLVVGIGGPPDPAFATYLGKPLLRPVLAFTSRRVRAAAKKAGARYEFLFMRADGAQLREVALLVDAGALRPVIDKVFPFEETVAALDYVDTGRAKGKVVVTMDRPLEGGDPSGATQNPTERP